LTEKELTKQVNNLYQSYSIKGEDLANCESPTEFVKYHPFMAEEYAEYVKHLKDVRIKTLLPDMDIPMRGLCPGEVLVILGRPHSGKTALAQSIMYRVWEFQGLPSLMFSLEMSNNQLYERGASMLAKKSGDEIEQIYISGDLSEIKTKVGGYEGVAYSDIPRLSVNNMRDVIEGLAIRPVLVVIDYLTIVGANGKTDIEKISSISKDIQALAKQTNTAIICLSQVSRKEGDEYTEIRLDGGYGSSAIEQDAFFIWAIWKNRERPNQRYLRLLKNKRGDAGATMQLGFLDPSPRLYPIQQPSFNTKGDDVNDEL
jgi:replicative DNA helicase